MSNYTQHIEDHYWSNVTAVQRSTKERFQTVRVGDAESELPAVIEQFRVDYTCSARRYLMNYFENRGQIIPALDQFSYAYGGSIYMFSRVTDEHVRSLDADERDTYIRLICAIAAENSGTEEKQWRPLARKAMLWNKQPDLLTKDEAFQLGHGLRMTLQEMDEFLLRVLDNDGLSYTRSQDTIEAFCFLYAPANDPRTAQRLRERYEAATRHVAKKTVQEKPAGFTVTIETSLHDRIRKWEEQGMDVQEAFLQWLVEKSPYLDIPGAAARRIYSRLAQLACQWIEDDSLIPDETGFSDGVLDFCLQEEAVLPDENRIYRMSEQILNTAALEFDNLRKRQTNQVWRYLTVDQKGRTTAVAVGSRIPQLLLGNEPITKADMLFMIWFVGDLCWAENTMSGQVIYDRTADFWTVSEQLLEEANLPGFYAPHMLERCFLRAISTRSEANAYPFEIYEGMCEFVLPEKQERHRSKQGKRMEKSRAQLEKETVRLFAEDLLSFEGVEQQLAAHFREHGKEKGKYSFTREGIAYLPDPRIIIPFGADELAERFDGTRPDYTQEEIAEQRFRFVFGLGLYLQQEAETFGVHCEFRTNYQKNVTLTVLCWEEN